MKVKLDALSSELINPFKHIRNWIKSEMSNLNALMEAISQKESCEVRKQACVKKLSEDRATLEKLQNNRFQLKTMFKNQS